MADWPPPGFQNINEPTAEPSSSDLLQGVLSGGVGPKPPPKEVPGGGPGYDPNIYERATTSVSQTLRKALPSSVADFLAETVIPQSDADALIFLATLPARGSLGLAETVGSKTLGKVMEASPGIRKGISTILAGMVGGSLDPNSSATQGGMRGLVAIGGDAAVNKITKLATYMPWLKKIANEDTEAVGDSLSNMIPQLGQIKSLKDFQKAFMHDYGGKKIQGEYVKALNEIDGMLGGQGISSPTYLQTVMSESGRGGGVRVGNLALPKDMGSGVPFMSVIDKVHALREEANKISQAAPVRAQRIFNTANQIEGEALESLPPEAQAKYTGAKRMYAKYKQMLDYFDEKDLVTNDGLDMQKLQNKFRAQGLSSSDAVISAAEVADFQRALFRGSDSSLITDFAPNAETHGRFHFMGFSVSKPGFLKPEKQFVGNVAERPGKAILNSSAILGGKVPSVAEFLAGKRPDVPAQQKPVSLAAPEDEE